MFYVLIVLWFYVLLCAVLLLRRNKRWMDRLPYISRTIAVWARAFETVIKGDLFPHKSNGLELTFQNLSRSHNYAELASVLQGFNDYSWGYVCACRRHHRPPGLMYWRHQGTAGSQAEPQPKSNLVHFTIKSWPLGATILMIFMRTNWPNFVQFNQTRMPSCSWQTRAMRKPCQKLLHFDVKTSYRQVNNLFEVMEIQCLVIKFLIKITSTYSS